MLYAINSNRAALTVVTLGIVHDNNDNSGAQGWMIGFFLILASPNSDDMGFWLNAMGAPLS